MTESIIIAILLTLCTALCIWLSIAQSKLRELKEALFQARVHRLSQTGFQDKLGDSLRVKVGNKWYSSATDGPICLQLSTKDKQNIKEMPSGATKYAIFPEEFGSREQMLDWME